MPGIVASASGVNLPRIYKSSAEVLSSAKTE